MQEDFNSLLRQRLPQHELVKVLQQLLGLSQAGVYRRLQGKTSYTIDETFRIAKHFGLSLDTLTGGGDDFITFRRTPYIKRPEDFVQYLSTSLAQLQSFIKTPGSELFYSAKDIPIYYQFRYPHLGPFKMRVWLNSLYATDVQEEGGVAVTQQMIDLSRELYRTYMSIPSTEIWNDTTVVSLFKQLEYYRDSGRIDDKDALLVLEDAESMIDWIYRQATLGQRMGESLTDAPLNVPFKMYYHDILIMDNHIYFRSPQGSNLFLAWAGLNYIKTADPRMIKEMDLFLNVQHSRSTLISGTAEIERLRWKRRAVAHLTALREKILNRLS